jgi:hypothetical protein
LDFGLRHSAFWTLVYNTLPFGLWFTTLCLLDFGLQHSAGKDAIKPLPNIITDPKQLDEFQHLDEMIEKLVSHFEHHDIADVFHVVFPDSSGNLERTSSGAVKTSNLFYSFTEVTVAQVAASNRWYSEYADDARDQCHTNLEWSRVYFANNVDSGLYTIINDNHRRHAQEEQGGPLLFMLLMQELFFLAQKTATSCTRCLRSFVLTPSLARI